MILYHPLNKPANLKAIEKFKDRTVKVYCKSKLKWLAINDEFICDVKKLAKIVTFKQALKFTKRFSSKDGIEYHFEDGFCDEKPNIKDFDFEDTINCPTVFFEENSGVLRNNKSSTGLN